MSVGHPAYLWLNEFGAVLQSAFGCTAYQVGSSVDSKQWRDVDVVLIMDDDLYVEWFGADTHHAQLSPLCHALTLAFCELGKRMTGLPIDFKFQQQSQANERFKGVRNALILQPQRGSRWTQ